MASTPSRPPTAAALKAAIPPAEFYRRHFPAANLKAKREGWTANFACPFHEDSTGSFGVNLETGAFRCFGCDAAGGSILDFHMRTAGEDLTAARAHLAQEWGIGPAAAATGLQRPRGATPPANRAHVRDLDPAKAAQGQPPAGPPPAPRPLAPIPEEALAHRPQAHPKHGPPFASYVYRDAAGRPIWFQHRFDRPAPAGKVFAAQSWTEAKGWQWQAPPAPRQPFGIETLTPTMGQAAGTGADPAAAPLVIITEGEKAALAARELFPGLPVLCASNGANAAHQTDWSALCGYRVRVAPDHDAAGAKYATAVAALVMAAGALGVEVLDLAALAHDPATGAARELVKGWDLADALAEGWTAATLASAARWRPWSPPGPPPGPRSHPGAGGPAGSASAIGQGLSDSPAADEATPRPAGLPEGFIVSSRGIFRRANPKDTPVFICPPFEVVAVCRDTQGQGFGRVCRFTDLDGQPREIVISDRERQGQGDALRQRLADCGFEGGTTSESRRWFLELLRLWTPPARARSVERCGWTEDGTAFVLPPPLGAIGATAEPVILAADAELPKIAHAGTLADWQATVAALAPGNSRLTFALSLALAPPLLSLARIESGGVNFHGPSSTGKTSLQRAAASIWGHPRQFLHQWVTTPNALEATAQAHSDLLLLLDDLGQLDPKAAAETAYLLANARGKGRLTTNATARPIRQWRLLFLSTGERTLGQHAAEGGKRLPAGAEVRCLEIPACPGGGSGVYEELHHHATGAALSAALTAAATQHHGHAGPAFVLWLVTHRERLLAELPRLVRDNAAALRERHRVPDTLGEVARAADRFALIAMAGHLATQAGILPWPQGEALGAASACFAAWLEARGGVVSTAERDVVEAALSFVKRHRGRYTWLHRSDDDRSPEHPNAAGYKAALGHDGTAMTLEFLTNPETFRGEVVAGFNPGEAIKILVTAKVLIPGNDGKATQKRRVPGFRNPLRFYVIHADRDEA